jgi:glutamate dehydrogenase
MISILNQKNDILEQVFAQLKSEFSERAQKILKQFINTVYRDVAVSDLTQMSPADLLGLTVSLWRESQIWKGDEAKIEIFNPDVEEDEWQSSHTFLDYQIQHWLLLVFSFGYLFFL